MDKLVLFYQMRCLRAFTGARRTKKNQIYHKTRLMEMGRAKISIEIKI